MISVNFFFLVLFFFFYTRYVCVCVCVCVLYHYFLFFYEIQQESVRHSLGLKGLKKKKKSPTGRDASRILPSTTSEQTPRLPKLYWLISKYYKPK